MNFQHTEDRRMLADTLNRFVSEQYGFATRDRTRALRPTVSAARLWSRFAELGIVGALFGEADGGFGGEGLRYRRRVREPRARRSSSSRFSAR